MFFIFLVWLGRRVLRLFLGWGILKGEVELERERSLIWDLLILRLF